MSRWQQLFAVLVLVAAVAADTPANCTFEDVAGKWTLWEGPRGVKPGTDCVSHPGEYDQGPGLGVRGLTGPPPDPSNSLV